MKTLGGVALAAVVAFGVGACSSDAPGALPGGIASSSCELGWMVGNSNTFFTTYAAAEAYANGPAAGTVDNLYSGASNPTPGEYGSIKVTAGQTISIYDVTVAYYDKNGTEIGSQQIAVGQTLTSGQPYSNVNGTPPSSATSCQVVTWTPGN